MYYEFDIDWKSMPLSFALIGEADIRSDQWWAKCRSTMLSQIRQHFSDDDIDEKEMLRWFEEFQHKYCEQRGHRLAPTPTGAKIIKLVYDEIAPYREMTEIMSDLEYEVKKLPELYSIYEALHSIIDIYDNYCLDLDEILESNPSQTASTVAAGDRNIVPADAGEGVGAAGEEKDAATKVSTTDFSHMRSFTPETAFDMSALYQFLVDEHVVVGVDEKQFADCINQANIEPLWETTESKNLFKLFLHTLKKYYQEPYQRQRRVNPKWFLVCCESIDVTTEYMGKMNFPKGDTRVKFCENMELCMKTIT